MTDDVRTQLAEALAAQHSCDTLLTIPLCNRCRQSAGAVLPVVQRLVAEAEARGRAERVEQAGIVVAALVARAELAEAAVRRVVAEIETFDVAQPRIAARIRAVVGGEACPVVGCTTRVPHHTHTDADGRSWCCQTESPYAERTR